MKKIMMLALLSLALSEGTTVPGILRLHVVANSNTEADQAVKLEVRDTIIEYMSEMRQFNSEQQAEEYVNEHLDDVESIAEQKLDEAGYEYGAKAQTGIFAFPEKQYGNTTLPAGDYHALRVTLGDGAGENWWCVLFPPLCYVEGEQVQEDWTQEYGIEYKSLIGEYFGN